MNRLQAVPVSSQVGRLYPAEAAVSVNGQRRKAMADQITTVIRQRLLRRLGTLFRDNLDSVGRGCLDTARLVGAAPP